MKVAKFMLYGKVPDMMRLLWSKNAQLGISELPDRFKEYVIPIQEEVVKESIVIEKLVPACTSFDN